MKNKHTTRKELLKSEHAYLLAANLTRIASTLSFAETLVYGLSQDVVPATIFASLTVGFIAASHICNKKQQKVSQQIEEENESQLFADEEELEFYKNLKFM